jgi:WD40 repeat protein
VWDVEGGEKICTCDKHKEWITRAAFAPDGKEVFSVGEGKKLLIWDAKTGKQRLAIDHPGPIWGLAVSPDGRYIVTGTGGTFNGDPTGLMLNQGDDNVVRMWDAAGGKLVREMKGHTHTVYTIDISPDGRLAVSGGWDGTIRLWELESGAELSRIEGGKGGVMRVLFSPDGKHVIVGGGVSRLAGQRITEFPDEQIRLYKVVEVSPQAASAQSK